MVVREIAKNIKEFFVKKNLLSYLVYSQNWLNLLMDGHHFAYINK
jgi:hypothetical protein